MKSTEIDLMHKVLTDVSIMCNVSMDRDLITIRSRVEAEGESFLTITLPSFAKDFEKSLEQGFIERTQFKAFKRPHTGSLIPAFLRGIVSMVFDPKDGTLREDSSIEAVDCVRQICYTFNKLKKECKDARQRKAIEAFLQCEADLHCVRLSTWKYRKDYRDIARIVFSGLFNVLQENLFDDGLIPKHGPGAVVEKLSGNAKFGSRTWTRRLSRAMPPDNYLFSNSEAWLEEHGQLTILDQKDEQPVKVMFVPKTQKSPRVIAIEPVHMQYAQQAFMKPLVELIEQDPILGKSIHFTDNSINGSLARASSMDRKFATLDMSEASDRVHAALVSDLFSISHRDLCSAIFAARSKTAQLPDGRVIALKKFASMGSALCFPMESMVFFTLCVLAGLMYTGKSASQPCIKDVASKITIFGDDIIVPAAWSGMCSNVLESVGLRVNHSKSFSRGYFRESCGTDAYKGHLVTPVYVRTSAPKAYHDTDELLSWAATANLFYLKGFWKTALYMRTFVEHLTGVLPHVTEHSSSVGWTSFQQYYSVERWNVSLSRFEVHGLTVHSRKKKDKLEGYSALLKYQLSKARIKRNSNLAVFLSMKKDGTDSYGSRRFEKIFRSLEDVQLDFESSTLRGSAYTKRRWTSPC